MQTRIEKDALGAVEIPGTVYWGVHTERALDNFKISGRLVPAILVQSIAKVKKAACLANRDLDLLSRDKAAAIIAAADEVISGKFADQFPLDALQGGAGTSTNMNVNEVIANRALELIGRDKGDYDFLHPLHDVNRHQSTNDVYPTALKIAAIVLFRQLSQGIAELQGIFQNKEKEFHSILKIGRTEYQEAVPMTLGAEFSAFAEAFSRDRWRIFKCEERLRVTNIGGTAIGTGLTAPRNFIFLVIERLREVTGLGLSRAENIPGETAFADSLAEVSGILMAHVCNLSKIANDLRLLNLLGEIRLPAVQAGSSIMPGKVNPVILEAVMQACGHVKASHMVILDCVARGSLQINEWLPVTAFHLLDSLDILIRINSLFSGHVNQITACPETCRAYAEGSPALVTAFLPHLGYEKAEALLKSFQESGVKNIRVFLNKELGQTLVDKVLSAESLTQLGHRYEPKNA